MYFCDYCEDEKWIGDGSVNCPKCNKTPIEEYEEMYCDKCGGTSCLC
jgi:hypothetical protein